MLFPISICTEIRGQDRRQGATKTRTERECRAGHLEGTVGRGRTQQLQGTLQGGSWENKDPDPTLLPPSNVQLGLPTCQTNMGGRGRGPLLSSIQVHLQGREQSAERWEEGEGPRDAMWQKMTVYNAFLSLLIGLVLRPHVSSWHRPGAKYQSPKSLVLWGSQALKFCLKAQGWNLLGVETARRKFGLPLNSEGCQRAVV